MRTSVASGACAGSPMSAIVRVGWPTVRPTGEQASQRAHRRWPHCRRSESEVEDQGALSPLATTGWWVPDLIRRTPISASQRRRASPAWILPRACPSPCRPKSGHRRTRPVSCRTAPAMAPRIAVTSAIRPVVAWNPSQAPASAPATAAANPTPLLWVDQARCTPAR
jgi:hypothetical protein